MSDPHEAIERWVAALPPETTSERVRSDFWYVRIPGVARRWIPVEIEVCERTVKLTSHVIIEPEEREADVFRLLLRHNHAAIGTSFSIDGREGVICLVARLEHRDVTQEMLDRIVGTMIVETETTFRSILEIGFGSRLKRGGSG